MDDDILLPDEEIYNEIGREYGAFNYHGLCRAQLRKVDTDFCQKWEQRLGAALSNPNDELHRARLQGGLEVLSALRLILRAAGGKMTKAQEAARMIAKAREDRLADRISAYEYNRIIKKAHKLAGVPLPT